MKTLRTHDAQPSQTIGIEYRISIVTELTDAGDEGMRNWVRAAKRGFENAGHHVDLLHTDKDPRWAAFHPATLHALRRNAPAAFLYVPYSGLTSVALLRHAALRRAAGGAIDALVVLQANQAVQSYPGFGRASLGAFASRRLLRAHAGVANHQFLFPPVVDVARFVPGQIPKSMLRSQLGLPSDLPMVLHVGHLKPSRGLEPLIELAKAGEATVVVVGSTSTAADTQVATALVEAGAIVKREYLPDIQAWYQAADVYAFPVVHPQGSIEVPLTVLEAMACGTPIITTAFGGLTDLFPSSNALIYAPAEAIPSLALSLAGADGGDNRAQVELLSLDAMINVFQSHLVRGDAA